MKTEIKINQIIDLLKKGFDAKSIAFELDLSINYIEACQKEYNKRLEYAKKIQAKDEDKERSQIEDSYNYKVEQMREKYKILTSSNTSSKKIDKIPQERKQTEKIDAYIELIQQIINEIESKDIIDRKRDIIKIIDIIEKIMEYKLSIEQAEKIIMLISDDKLIKLNYVSNSNISQDTIKAITLQLRSLNGKIAFRKQGIELKLLNAIEEEIDKANDIETLNELSSKLTIEMKKDNPLNVSNISQKINRKIRLLQQKLCVDSKANIPSYVREIADSISKDEFDYEGAIALIEENTQKLLENSTKSRFALSKEQQKGKIIAQIRQALINNAEEYFILNPQRAIDNLSKLQDGEEPSAINTIVRNLAKRGCIEEANQICDKYRRDSKYYKDMKILKRIISEEEIKKFVLGFLSKSSTTSQENKQFVNELDSKLQEGKVDLTSIILGQNPISLKNITLKNVYDYVPAKSER